MFHLLLLLLSFTALAQDRSFSLSGDAKEIYFQSDLLLRSNPDSDLSRRLYQYAPKEPILITRSSPLRRISGSFLSTDAQTWAIFELSSVVRPSFFAFPQDSVRIRRNGKETSLGGGGFRVSRNGRFVLNLGFPTFYPNPVLHDLDQERAWSFPILFPLSVHSALSDAGTLVAEATQFPGVRSGQGKAVYLAAIGEEPRLLYQGDLVHHAAISPDGLSVFVVTETASHRFQVLEVLIADGSSHVIWEGSGQPLSLIPSSNGSRLLMNLPGSLWLWERSTRAWELIAGPDPKLGQALLSDNGQTAVFSRGSNSLYRLDIATAEIEELYPPFPSEVSFILGSAEPGSLMGYSAVGVLPAVKVEVEGVSFPVLEAKEDSLRFQVPWDFALAGLAPGGLQITQPASPFLAVVPFQLNPEISPRLVTFYDPVTRRNQNLAALRQDFSGYLNETNPAPAGSTIHIYVTGLGPLDRPLKTLEPGPVDPPAKPLSGLACRLHTEKGGVAPRQLDLPFVAYAPGLVGVYQVDATIPDDWPAGEQTLYCSNSSDESYVARTWATLWTTR